MHANNNRGHRKVVTTSSSTKPPNSSDESELFSYRDVAIYGAGLLAAGVGLYVARYKKNSGSNKKKIAQYAAFTDATSATGAEKAIQAADEKMDRDIKRLVKILDEMARDETTYDLEKRKRLSYLVSYMKHENKIEDELQTILDTNETDDAPIKTYFLDILKYVLP
jgi:hypothetical protein